jgi:hypothetical protein
MPPHASTIFVQKQNSRGRFAAKIESVSEAEVRFRVDTKEPSVEKFS